MSPELVGAVLQFGAMGLLALAVYHGLNQMAAKDAHQAEAMNRMIDALMQCMEMKAQIEERLDDLEARLP